VLGTAEVTLPKAHCDKVQMSKLSKEIKNNNKDVFCKVPFCSTVEAEAFGGDIKLGDEKNGPRINKYIFNNVDELQNIARLDITKGRIKEVLQCLDILKSEGEVTVLKVTGPLTIISSLVEPTLFYKVLRKNKELVNRFMKVIEKGIIEYIKEGIKRGADIISYADPSGSLDIVGPKVFKEVVGATNYNIIRAIEPYLNNTVIHLCGKLSSGLEKCGFLMSEPVKFSTSMRYGDAILELKSSNKSVKFIGNGCLKKSPLIQEEPVVWRLVFTT